MADISKEYKTISQIAGPLVYVKNTEPVGYNEIVSIRLSDGTMRRGQVLDSSNDLVVVQVFEGTTGIDRDASVRFLGETMKMPVSRAGRCSEGSSPEPETPSTAVPRSFPRRSSTSPEPLSTPGQGTARLISSRPVSPPSME